MIFENYSCTPDEFKIKYSNDDANVLLEKNPEMLALLIKHYYDIDDSDQDWERTQYAIDEIVKKMSSAYEEKVNTDTISGWYEYSNYVDRITETFSVTPY